MSRFRPAMSAPRRPMNATSAPSADAHAATLAPEPPPCVVTLAGVSLPRASGSVACATVSVIKSPMTTMRAMVVITSSSSGYQEGRARNSVAVASLQVVGGLNLIRGLPTVSSRARCWPLPQAVVIALVIPGPEVPACATFSPTIRRHGGRTWYRWRGTANRPAGPRVLAAAARGHGRGQQAGGVGRRIGSFRPVAAGGARPRPSARPVGRAAVPAGRAGRAGDRRERGPAGRPRGGGTARPRAHGRPAGDARPGRRSVRRPPAARRHRRRPRLPAGRGPRRRQRPDRRRRRRPPAPPPPPPPLPLRPPPVAFAWWPCGSGEALRLARAGLVHAAGVHTQAGNGDVGAVLPDGGEVVGFTAWREGLTVRPGLRPVVTGPDAIARRGLRIVNREPGAEARR